MKKKLVLTLVFAFMLLLPFSGELLAQGQGTNTPPVVVSTAGSTSIKCDLGSLGGWLCQIGSLLNSVVPVLIALAVVYFVWGVISYVIGDDEEAKQKGRDRIIFGIIGLVAIIGMWGLVRVLAKTFGLNNTYKIELPTVPVVLE